MDWQKLILKAFKRGTIRCIGGTLYDRDMNMVGSNHDMLKFSRTHHIERIDSGGSPQWILKSK